MTSFVIVRNSAVCSSNSCSTPSPLPILAASMLVVIISTGAQLPHASCRAETVKPAPGPVEETITPKPPLARA